MIRAIGFVCVFLFSLNLSAQTETAPLALPVESIHEGEDYFPPAQGQAENWWGEAKKAASEAVVGLKPQKEVRKPRYVAGVLVFLAAAALVALMFFFHDWPRGIGLGLGALLPLGLALELFSPGLIVGEEASLAEVGTMGTLGTLGFIGVVGLVMMALNSVNLAGRFWGGFYPLLGVVTVAMFLAFRWVFGGPLDLDFWGLAFWGPYCGLWVTLSLTDWKFDDRALQWVMTVAAGLALLSGAGLLTPLLGSGIPLPMNPLNWLVAAALPWASNHWLAPPKPDGSPGDVNNFQLGGYAVLASIVFLAGILRA